MSRVLAERLDASAETHWELLAAAERAGLDEQALAALRRMTRIYERTAFAPESVPAEDQRWACRVATRLRDLVASVSARRASGCPTPGRSRRQAPSRCRRPRGR